MNSVDKILNHPIIVVLFPKYAKLDHKKRLKWFKVHLRYYKYRFSNNRVNKVLIALFTDFIGVDKAYCFAKCHYIEYNIFRGWLEQKINQVDQKCIQCKNAVIHYILYQLGLNPKFTEFSFALSSPNKETLLPKIVSKYELVSYVPPDLDFRYYNLLDGVEAVISKITQQTKYIFIINTLNQQNLLKSFDYLIENSPEHHYILLCQKIELDNFYRHNKNITVILEDRPKNEDVSLSIIVWTLAQKIHQYQHKPTITLFNKSVLTREIKSQVESNFDLKVINLKFVSRDLILDCLFRGYFPPLVQNIDSKLRDQLLEEYRVIKSDINRNIVEIVRNLRQIVDLMVEYSHNKSYCNYTMKFDKIETKMTTMSYREPKTVLSLFMRLDILKYILQIDQIKLKSILDTTEKDKIVYTILNR